MIDCLHLRDDGPLRRDAHADVIREAPVNGLPEGREVLAVRGSGRSQAKPQEERRYEQQVSAEPSGRRVQTVLQPAEALSARWATA